MMNNQERRLHRVIEASPDWFQRVDGHTRAGKRGKHLVCPHCCAVSPLVFHFSWEALGCVKCKAMVEKRFWIVAYVGGDGVCRILSSDRTNLFTLEAPK